MIAVPERTLPHNLDAERAILGALLIENAVYSDVLPLLTPESFFRDAHRRIWQHIDRLIPNQQVDLVILKESLEQSGELDEVGGPSYLATLVDGVPLSSNAKYYAAIVRDKKLLRDVIYASNSALSDAYEADQAPATVVKAATAKLAEVALRTHGDGVVLRRFTLTGDQRYRLELEPHGIVLEADRVRRDRNELWAEVRCRVNGSLPHAKRVYDDVLHTGDLNFSSVQARSSRAKIFATRSGSAVVDWEGLVEEFAYRIQEHERSGRPAVVLADEAEEAEDSKIIEVSGWPILMDLPMVLFGDSSSGKSYWAMWVAASLAEQGIPVLYADWEFSTAQHRQRLGRMFKPMPKLLYYVRCDRPMVHEIERLNRLVAVHKILYVVGDSIGFACDGPAESAEAAAGYFRAVRQLKVGSLHIAHIPKQYDDGREAQIFGSVFFKAGARSVWFIERTQNNPKGEVSFGLYHRKNNLGDLLAPRGYKLLFRDNRTLIETVNVQESDELASKLPLLDRMKRYLGDGAKTVKDIADEMNCSAAAVRAIVSRHKSSFIRVGTKVGLVHAGLGF